MHRDLKAANILIWTKDIKAKILDFGMAHGIDSSSQSMHTFAGTPYCMAPEILIGNNQNEISYTKKIDFWSFGILIYLLCC